MLAATSLTEAGYVGDDVENILLRLIQAADFDIDKAEKGIIYVDERLLENLKTHQLHVMYLVKVFNKPYLKFWRNDCKCAPQGGRKHPNQELIH